MKYNKFILTGSDRSEEDEIDFSLLDRYKLNLKSITFSKFNKKQILIKNIETLYNLDTLRVLYAQDKLPFYIDLVRFKNLEQLGINYSSKIINLNKSKNLKILVISKDYAFENLIPINDLENLEVLHIYSSSKIKTLNGISKLHKLKELNLAYGGV